MNKAKVFITRNLPEIGIQLLAEFADLDIWPGDLPPDQPSLLEHCAGVDGILCLLTDRMDAAVMDAAGPQLKVISQYAVGYDNIDIAAATQRGIPVGNTPGVLTDATADMTWALLMAAARRIVESDRFVREGSWKTWGPTLLLGPEVAHSTLGIVGFGRIGQAVARRARGFDMRVLYYSRNRQQDMEQMLGVEFAPLEQLLREADFISLHTPLTPQTKNLISSRELSLMKPSSVLINTARGGIVDHTALYHALASHQIAYAALDVTDPEPIPMDSPLLKLDNIIITPHTGSAGIKTRAIMAEMAARNLIAGLLGKPLPNCVNPQVYA